MQFFATFNQMKSNLNSASINQYIDLNHILNHHEIRSQYACYDDLCVFCIPFSELTLLPITNFEEAITFSWEGLLIKSLGFDFTHHSYQGILIYPETKVPAIK